MPTPPSPILTPTVPHTAHPLDVRFIDTDGATIFIHPGTVRVTTALCDGSEPVTSIQTPQGYHLVPLSLPAVGRILYPSAADHQKLQDEIDELRALFERQSAQMAEAVHRWRQAHSGNHHTIPELRTVLTWLLAELDQGIPRPG